MSASTGTPAMPRRLTRHSRRRACRVAAPRQSSHRHQPDGTARRGRQPRCGARIAIRCMSPARTSTAIATPRHAPLAFRRRPCGSSHPMSAAALARRISPTPEHALILWAAKRVGRPVKWIATRSEGFVSDHQARDHQADAALALDAGGRFLALRVASVANIGAYMAGGSGGVQTNQYIHLQGTIYRIPAIALHIRAVLSNTTPIGVTRAPGFAELVNIIEKLIDRAARQCGFDRADLRRRNMVAGRCDADDQCSGLRGGQRPFRRDIRSRARPSGPSRLRGTTRRQRCARMPARSRICLSHQGNRRFAARERRYPI